MVLHGEHRLAGMAEPFDRAVIKVEMGHLDVGRQRARIDGESVILRGDFHLARLELLDRMVRAAMAELQLERLSADGEAEDLVTQADAEGRYIGLHELPDVVHRVGQGRAVAWTAAA